jgi:CheY-like chemotaxis protein
VTAVLIVDDHGSFRATARKLLEAEGFEVVGEAESGEAALEAIQRLRPDGATPRVRMGIHAGRAEPSGDTGYVGLDVHRAARVCAAATGGQILVSSAARALAGDDTEFADLGEHRLQGFADRERIFQVLHDDLPGDLRPPAANGSPKGAAMRVVIADDSVLLREGIAKLLEDSGFDVAGQSTRTRRSRTSSSSLPGRSRST